MVSLIINGKPVCVPEGTSILEAARAANIDIPTLCYLKDLELLTARDAHEKMLGRKIEPKEYIDFMIGWSGVFSGAKPSLELPMAFMIFKGAQKH
jgi:hypothetical protein